MYIYDYIYNKIIAIQNPFNENNSKNQLADFRDYLNKQPIIRCYLENPSGTGHLGSTVNLVFRMAETVDLEDLNFGYTGIIEVYYKGSETVKKELQRQFGFGEATSGPVANATVKLFELGKEEISDSVAFGFTGGADYHDPQKNYAQLLQTDYFLRIQPYAWPYPEELQFLDPKKKTIELTKQKVLGGSFFNLRIYYVPEKRYTEASEKNPKTKNEEIVKWLMDDEQLDNIRVMVTYGIRDGKRCEVNNTPEFAVTLLSGSLLAWQKEGEDDYKNAMPVVIVNFDTLSKGCIEYAEKLLAGDPTHLELGMNDNPAGNPVFEARKKYMELLDAKNRFNVLVDPKSEEVKSAVNSVIGKKDRVIFIQLGRVDPPYFYYALYKSNLPPLIEGQNSANMALGVGKPYLQCRSRQHEGKNFYCYPAPTLSYYNPYSTPSYMEWGANQVKLNLNQWPEKDDDSPCRRLGVKLLRTITNETSNNCRYRYYFNNLKEFFFKPTQDKLCVAAAYVNKLIPKIKEIRPFSPALDSGQDNPLNPLYDLLKKKVVIGQKLDLIPGILSQGQIPHFFQEFLKDLTGSLTFIVTQFKHQGEEGDIKNITLKGDSDIFKSVGVETTGIKVFYTASENKLLQTTTFTFEKTWSMPGAPWIEFNNIYAGVLVADSPWPTAGTLGGTYKPLDMTLSTQLPSEKNQWLLSAAFKPEYPGIDKVFQMAGGIDLVQTMPPPLNALTDLGISYMECAYDLKLNKLQAISFICERNGSDPLHLVGDINLDNLKIQAMVFLPKTERNFCLKASCDFQIGTGKDPAIITISVSYPNFVFQGELTSGKIILASLLKKFLPGVELELASTPSIDEFSFNYTKETDNLSVSMNFNIQWTFSFLQKDLFTIDRVGFSITRSKGKNTGFISGTTLLLPKSAKIKVDIGAFYQGGGAWRFTAQQKSGVININDLLKEYIDHQWVSSLTFPKVNGLNLSLDWVKKKATAFQFTAETAEPWKPLENVDITATGNLKIGYGSGSNIAGLPVPGTDGVSANNEVKGLYGSLNAEVNWKNITLSISYNFDPQAKSFKLTWKGITGTIEEKTVSGVTHYIGILSFSGWTLGGMIEEFISWATGQKFGLAAPWNLLDHINLDKLKLKFNFTTKQVTFAYDIGPINLGLATINSINVSYETADKAVMVTLDGSFLWQSDHSEPLKWDATDPAKTPAPPGQGNKYFELRLLALGQHVSIAGSESFTSVKQAIEKMTAMAVPTGNEIPLPAGTPQPGQPYFNPDSSWLVGMDFGILRIKDRNYVFNLSVIFNDPNLYGLRIALAGDQAKIFKGLDFQIMYKKISDTVGVYMAEIKLPDKMRNLTVGAYTITLPIFAIEIYTNGDFKVDVGFPWNMDFSRSFTIQGIVMAGPIPIPVLGSAGFYFGKLSSATSNQVPKTNAGNFNPVIVFGIGLQFGVGKYIEMGVLRAGFSITAAGALEGVIAKWNPIDAGNTGTSPGNQLQGQYFFRMQGTVGIIGKLYGTVDFAIVKADVNIEVKVLAQITYESYASIPISVSASVDVRVSVKVNCGLFKITIKFSFSARIKATFVIQNSGTPPWADNRLGSRNFWALQQRRLRDVRMRRLYGNYGGNQDFTMHWSNLAAVTDKVGLNAYIVPSLTVFSDKLDSLSDQKVCYVPMVFIESMAPEQLTTAPGGTSFEILCKQVLRWAIAASRAQGSYTAAEIDDMVIKDETFHDILNYLSGKLPASEGLAATLPATVAEAFMDGQFQLNIGTPSSTLEKTAAVFAMPRLLGLDVPAFDGVPAVKYSFDQFSNADDNYLGKLRSYFDKLAVVVQQELDPKQTGPLKDEAVSGQSIASFVFGDYFLLIVRQMVQGALDALRTFKWPIDDTYTIKALVDWVNSNGDLSGEEQFTAVDLFEGNTNHEFNKEKPLTISGPIYNVRENDSLDSISKEFKDAFTATELAVRNAGKQDIINAGVHIGPKEGTGLLYTTQAGDTFATIAAAIAGSSIDRLFDISNIAGLSNLLKPESSLYLSPYLYHVGGSDTIGSILTSYSSGFSGPQLARQNILTAGLFTPGAKFSYTVDKSDKTYTVQKDDTFMSIAAAVSGGDLNQLFEISNITGVAGLLRPLAILELPPVLYKTAAGDAPVKIAGRFNIPVRDLANAPANLSVSGLFMKGKTKTSQYLNITHLSQFKVADLIREIEDTGALTHLSAMVSRYSLHGMRLPIKINDDAITFMAGINMPAEAGLYRITGQQFAVPTFASNPKDTYSITITKPAALPWVVFDGKVENTTYTITPTETDKKAITALHTYATGTGLKPQTAYLGTEPVFKSTPAQYNIVSTTAWNSAGIVKFPYGSAPDGTNPPLNILQLPDNLVNLPHRQEPGKIVIQPRFSLNIGTFNEATSVMDNQKVSCYGWGTKVDVGIKRIPAVPGSPASKYTYELMGTNQYDILFLERLLAEVGNEEELIHSLTLLYSPNPSGKSKKGLLSDDAAKVSRFISQVNLTTVTRPPGNNNLALGAAQEQQSNLDFLRQLWENSITRSGGYFLYYYNSETEEGFPSEIFNDKGEANLVLLVTWSDSLDNRVSGYMNCAVAGEAFDVEKSVVYAQSDPLSQVTYPPTETDTLEHIASMYYMSPIRLAEDNSSHPLTPGNPVIIENGSYEVGGNNSGNPQTIADHFKITLKALQDANQEIKDWSKDFPAFQALKLPEITVTLGSSPGGTTLAGLAQYYGVTVAQIAGKNQDKEGLFSTGASLSISGGPNTRIASTPPGTVPLGARRTVPNAVPADPGDPDYGKLYMEHMFNMLGYRVMNNIYFSGSNPGLPMGPVEKPGEEENGEKIRQPQPDKQPGEFWEYRQTVPFYKFPPGKKPVEDASLPLPENSPYNCTDGLLQVYFQWLDIFGNQAVTPLNNPGLEPTAPLNAPPVWTGLTDRLIGLSQWPGVSADYCVETINGAANFNITLKFDPTPYLPPASLPGAGETPAWKKAAQLALVTYTSLYYQVNQQIPPKKKITPPPPPEYMVDFSISSTLLSSSPIPVDRKPIADWIEQIYRYVHERSVAPGNAKADSFKETAPAQLTVNHTIKETEIDTGQIFQLTTSFNMNRDIGYVNAEFKDSPGAYASKTPVSPKHVRENVSGEPSEKGTFSLKQFAEDFETTLHYPGQYQLKLANGANRDRASAGLQSPLWVVRLGLVQTQPIHYRVTNPGKPGIFVPRPLANILQTHTQVPIYDYTTGTGISPTVSYRPDFTGIDMDVWMKEFLNAVDDFLTPAYTSALGLLSNHESKNYLEEIKLSKTMLANVLAKLVIPVFEDETAGGAELSDAQEAFKQQLLVRLSNFYNTDAVIQFGAAVNAAIKTRNPNYPPRLFGSPIKSASGLETAEASPVYTLTDAKLELKSAAAENPNPLTFLLSTRDKKKKEENKMESYITLDLDFKGTHIEHQIDGIPGIDDYRASSWLSFLRPSSAAGDQPLNVKLGRFEVPLVLRAFPTPPSMKNQVGKASYPPPEQDSAENKLEKVTQWNYSFTYGEDYHYAQDRTYFTIQFNIKDKLTADLAHLPLFFYSMAEFITVYPGIKKDLVDYLAKIDGSTTDPDIIKNAKVAVESFIKLVADVTTHWDTAFLQNGELDMPVDGQVYGFYIFEMDHNGDLMVLLKQTFSMLPLIIKPQVGIPGYTPVSATVPPGITADLCWTFEDDKKKPLSSTIGQGIPDRKVTLPPLNILAYQDAQSSALLVRNQYLLKDQSIETAEPFVYKTANIKFANPLHPTLDVSQTIDISTLASSPPSEKHVTQSLALHLSTLFQQLFKDDPEPVQTIQLECRYQYTIQDKLSPISLPVIFLAPSSFDTRTGWKVPTGGCPEPGGSRLKVGETDVCQLNGSITEWFKAQKPCADNGTLCFDLTVMSNLTKRPMPILRLRNLKLDLQYIKPALPTD